MAIDTAAKRASVQAYTLGLTRPPADGTISAADRAHAAWFYSGITYAAVVVVETASGFFLSGFNWFFLRW